MDIRQVRLMKIVLLASSLASLLLLASAAYQENIKGQWRANQENYRALLVSTAADDNARRAAASFTVEHKQIYLPELGRIDRCTTCHLGVENPAVTDAPPPLQTHSGKLLAQHPPERFGCTICHRGRGRAISEDAAHGWRADGSAVPDVPEPLLRGKAVYTSCGGCHAEVDLFGGEADLYADSGEQGTDQNQPSPIDQASLSRSLPGAEPITRGKALVTQLGCLGCHKYHGRGGVLGPDITYVGDKIKHDFDFTHVEGEHTVRHWLFEHFKLPRDVSPNTTMPDYGLTDQQADDLATYMMSLHRKTAIASHTPRPRVAEGDGEPASGQALFQMLCSACHGAEGLGTTMRSGFWPTGTDPWGHQLEPRDIVVQRKDEYELMVPSLNNPDTLAVVSDDFLRYIITNGRSDTNMPGWGIAQGGGLRSDEIDRLVQYIRGWEPSPPPVESVAVARGNPQFGRALYQSRCAGCHGREGGGSVGGVNIRLPAFLAAASDEFLRDSIIDGRSNTAMPSWKQLNGDEVSDILAYLRTLEPPAPDRKVVLTRTAAKEAPASSDKVAELYTAKCATCHGGEGEGAIGPPLNSDAFLSIVDDGYLYDAIVLGRPTTAMPAWKSLSAQDVAGLIRFMRAWNEDRRRTLDSHTAQGDAKRGETLFGDACATCHGAHAEGGTGPQLNNPVFLGSASDAMLRAWIGGGDAALRRAGHGDLPQFTDWQVDDVIAYLRKWQHKPRVTLARLGLGDAEAGADVYEENCVDCHGPEADEPTGVPLYTPEFLRAASDGYLHANIATERSMPELGLSAEEITNVVAFIRSWEQASPIKGIPARYVMEADVDAGATTYASQCAGCHGVEGTGGWAPQLNNPEFLAAATDGFLQATIIRGRTNTAMRSFGIGGGGVAELSADEINNIVAYIRTWAPDENKPGD